MKATTIMSKFSILWGGFLLINLTPLVSGVGSFSCLPQNGFPDLLDCLEAAYDLIEDLRTCEDLVHIPDTVGHNAAVGTCEVFVDTQKAGIDIGASSILGVLSDVFAGCDGAFGTADVSDTLGIRVGTFGGGVGKRSTAASPSNRDQLRKRQNCFNPGPNSQIAQADGNHLRRLNSFPFEPIPVTPADDDITAAAQSLATAVYTDRVTPRHRVDIDAGNPMILTVAMHDQSNNFWGPLIQITQTPDALADLLVQSIKALAQEGNLGTINDINPLNDFTSPGAAVLSSIIFAAPPPVDLGSFNAAPEPIDLGTITAAAEPIDLGIITPAPEPDDSDDIVPAPGPIAE